jgi:1-acyl-sn-glycerol-3-phosphate acyltransferase
MTVTKRRPDSATGVHYPRRRLPRALCRATGRLLIPILCRLELNGEENFPERGPLLVVGNHTAVMETILLTVYTPWQIEMLGSIDIPHERITDIVSRFYGYIPIRRGRMEKTSMIQALSVLEQNGILGIFPEGGIWDSGAMRAQTGVAWLSYRSGAPVLPLGFSGTKGALGAAFRFQQPEISMRVGKPLPPAHLPKGTPRKIYFQEYAETVMQAVNALLPEDSLPQGDLVYDENFELRIVLESTNGGPQTYPSNLSIEHSRELTKFLHRPGILKIFRKNLHMPIDALQNLDHSFNPAEIAHSTELILDYLEKDNPYLLIYRFGPKEAQKMHQSLEELLDLARWADKQGLELHLTPIRRYRKAGEEDEIVQVKQGRFEDWM